MWVQDLQGAMDHEESSRRNPFVENAASTHDFNDIVRLVEAMGNNYGQYQNLECRGLKNALLDLSDGAGRVRLSKFYSAAFANTSQHFSESPDYLRHLGVLDETDPQQPSVILANYMYSRANCLASSSFYAICCIDECEALLAGLERRLASPLAEPEIVADLVSSMSSETVSAPRNLSAALRRRLDDIAERHGGKIPLHGRLFTQWMHHAFPNECAYPHTTGSLASPLTPTEWLRADGEAKRSIKASQEEMQSVIDADVKLNLTEPADAAEDIVLLPWTEEEELLVATPAAHPLGGASHLVRFAAIGFAIVSSLGGLVRMLGSAAENALPLHAAAAGKQSWWSAPKSSHWV